VLSLYPPFYNPVWEKQLRTTSRWQFIMQGALATGLAATAVNTKDDGFAQLKTD